MTLKHGISPTQGSWADVNLALKIDMRYRDIDGSLERLYAMARSTDHADLLQQMFDKLGKELIQSRPSNRGKKF